MVANTLSASPQSLLYFLTNLLLQRDRRPRELFPIYTSSLTSIFKHLIPLSKPFE